MSLAAIYPVFTVIFLSGHLSFQRITSKLYPEISFSHTDIILKNAFKILFYELEMARENEAKTGI